ncbi:hypothetical protein SRHO_G00106580 [Serrasalmus rhombeus]
MQRRESTLYLRLTDTADQPEECGIFFPPFYDCIRRSALKAIFPARVRRWRLSTLCVRLAQAVLSAKPLGPEWAQLLYSLRAAALLERVRMERPDQCADGPCSLRREQELTNSG